MCTGDIQGGSWDVLEDPPDSVEGYVYMGHPGRILGCPTGSSRQCGEFWGIGVYAIQGGSWDVLQDPRSSQDREE